MCAKDADGMADSVDLDQTAPWCSLIWVYTVCPDFSVRKLRIIIAHIQILEELVCHPYCIVVLDILNS